MYAESALLLFSKVWQLSFTAFSVFLYSLQKLTKWIQRHYANEQAKQGKERVQNNKVLILKSLIQTCTFILHLRNTELST